MPSIAWRARCSLASVATPSTLPSQKYRIRSDKVLGQSVSAFAAYHVHAHDATEHLRISAFID